MLETGMFCVGYSKVDITPSEPMRMSGYAQPPGGRYHKVVLDPIYLTCVAFSDGKDNTVLIYTMDLVGIEDPVAEKMRQAVTNAMNLPGENLFFTATHTHSAPSCTDLSPVLEQAAVQAATEALADRKPARVYFGKANTSGISFVRHYYDLNGRSVTVHHGDRHAQLSGHATAVDEEMRILRIQRADGKDVILANWQCHPRLTGGTMEFNLSADMVGAMRLEMEAALDCCFAYYQGGAGNIDPISWIEGEEAHPVQDYRLWGKSMAAAAKAAMQDMTEVKTGEIRLMTEEYICQSNKVDLDKEALAQKVVDFYREGHTTAETKPYAESLGLASYYHASNILMRRSTPDSYSFTVSAVVMGDLGWVLAPGEYYDSTMKYIRDNSPCPYNFTVGWNSGNYSYYPSLKGWEYGSYETDTARAAPGTAEGIANCLLQMLNTLKH